MCFSLGRGGGGDVRSFLSPPLASEVAASLSFQRAKKCFNFVISQVYLYTTYFSHKQIMRGLGVNLTSYLISRDFPSQAHTHTLFLYSLPKCQSGVTSSISQFKAMLSTWFSCKDVSLILSAILLKSLFLNPNI